MGMDKLAKVNKYFFWKNDIEYLIFSFLDQILFHRINTKSSIFFSREKVNE